MKKEEEKRIRVLREEKEGKERAYRELMEGLGDNEGGEWEGGEGEGEGGQRRGRGRSNVEGWDEEDFM